MKFSYTGYITRAGQDKRVWAKDYLETTLENTRMKQGSNTDRTGIEQGQIPYLIPVLSLSDNDLTTSLSKPASIRSDPAPMLKSASFER